ncbi:MAG: hypothetical protein NTU77_04265, partial [Actinobacteria bacterium]|nr:hypothetical protein [Actinomycetota bacterium]
VYGSPNLAGVMRLPRSPLVPAALLVAAGLALAACGGSKSGNGDASFPSALPDIRKGIRVKAS